LARTKTIAASLVAGSLVVDHDEATGAQKKPLTILEPKEYSHTFQLRQAAANSIDSSMRLLFCSLQTLQTGYGEYIQLLNDGIMWLNTAVEINIILVENCTLEDKLIEIRAEILSCKSKINETLFIYEEIVKLLNSCIGVAFLTGNDAASSVVSTYLYSTQKEIERMKVEAATAEKDYLELLKKLSMKSKPGMEKN